MYTIRVDGYDIFAVYNATKAAREYALGPYFCNMMPYLILCIFRTIEV
jgi:TPP-dependent pyruvate/acetoin dehydrogenase alpha subunit